MGRISTGMAKEQVAEILGSPSQAATGRVYDGPNTTYPGASEVHLYTEIRGGQTNEFIVVFNKGRVTEYGPYVGGLRGRYDVFKP
jgi:hypothetical protein